MQAIRGSKIMILGAYGQVGTSLSKLLLTFSPKTLYVSSLREEEANECASYLEKFKTKETEIVPLWGNVYFPYRLKDKELKEIMDNEGDLQILLNFTFSELSESVIMDSLLFQQISEAKPEIIIDCINTAQALAYGDIYSIYEDLLERRKGDLLRKTLLLSGLPQLVRHIQLLYESLKRNNVKLYIKVGTTGTGGMGLNLPFTHGEAVPSRLLMLKSAFAGAHSMLLFVLSKTPDSPPIKEVKPATLIAWKNYGKGKIKRAGRGIPLYDSDSAFNFTLKQGSQFDLRNFPKKQSKRFLEGTYIDTGENGLFSLSEFKVITSLGLMEFVTPEEVASYVIDLITGRSTSKDVISALDSSSVHSSYKAGYIRQSLISEVESLKEEGITYGLLGPRVSKLLLEAHLLKFSFESYSAFLKKTPVECSRISEEFILKPGNPVITSALSLGIPILLKSGSRLIFARRDTEERIWEKRPWKVSKENIDRFAETEWIDLRRKNMERWKKRIKEMKSIDIYLDLNGPIDPSYLVAFVLKNEFGGGRGGATIDQYSQ